MSRLSSPNHSKSAMAPPLPVTNRILNQAGITFRRSQFSLVVAAPGVGKTLFASNLALWTPVPTVYFSADSDEWTTKVRTAGTVTGQQLYKVEKDLADPSWEPWYLDQLHMADHIDWCYQVDIDPDFISHRIRAYDEKAGEYPDLIVVDNLGNTTEEQGDEYAELRATCRDLQRQARRTRAHVMGLHHVIGKKEDGNDPIDLSDLIGKIGKLPELVIGLNRAGPNTLNLTVPKQRLGRGNFAIHLPIDYTTATIGGYR